MTASHDLSRELQDALRPLYRRLDSARTLSIGKVGLLGRLDRGGPATASQIAGVLRISPQAVTIAVRELEAEGLVARTPDPDDRRRSWIALTEAGRARFELERGAGGAWLAEAIDGLDEASRAALTAAVPVLARLAQEDADA